MKQDQKYSFISYVLSGQRWWCNIRRFWVIQKIASANLYKPIHDIINYSISICPCESGKCGKKGEKLQKFEYLANEKSFFDEIKTFFIVFEGPSFGENIKILWKLMDTRLKKLYLFHYKSISVILFWCQKHINTSKKTIIISNTIFFLRRTKISDPNSKWVNSKNA